MRSWTGGEECNDFNTKSNKFWSSNASVSKTKIGLQRNKYPYELAGSVHGDVAPYMFSTKACEFLFLISVIDLSLTLLHPSDVDGAHHKNFINPPASDCNYFDVIDSVVSWLCYQKYDGVNVAEACTSGIPGLSQRSKDEPILFQHMYQRNINFPSGHTHHSTKSVCIPSAKCPTTIQFSGYGDLSRRESNWAHHFATSSALP